MSQVISLPSITTKEIFLLNQLVRLSLRFFSEGHLPAPLIPDYSASPAQAAKTQIELRWDNLPIYLYLNTSLSELAASLLPVSIDLSSLSEDITFALFEKAILANHATILDVPLYLQKIEHAGPIPDNCYIFQWQAGHPILHGQLYIPHHIAPALINKLTSSFAHILPEYNVLSSEFLAKIPFPIRMDLGELNLSLRELKGLHQYDLLLPEKSYFTAGVIHLRLSPSLGFTVRLKNNTCTVITPLESYRAHMDNNEYDFDDDFKKFLEDIPETLYGNDAFPEKSEEEEEEGYEHAEEIVEETQHAQSAEQNTSLDDIEIRLTFDIGNLQLTLGELARITPGHTFDLGKSICKAVSIRANGTLIGKGELVDIEGTIGVSIVELYQRGKE